MEGVLCNFEIVEPLVSEAQGLNGFSGHSAIKSLLPKRIGYSNAKFAGFVIETSCAPESPKMHHKISHPYFLPFLSVVCMEMYIVQ